MAGCSAERVMGLLAVNQLPNEPAVGNNDTYNTGFNGKFSDGTESTTGIRNLPDSKYYDLYAYGTTEIDQEAYDRGMIGDFTRELEPVRYKSWNNDYANFIFSNDPVFNRGGNWSSGAATGIFWFDPNYSGDVYRAGSFRPVMLLF